VRVSKIIEG